MINLLSCSPFYFLLLPQHNFSKSYHKQSAIIPILIWMCWIFSFFWRFIAILMSLIFWLLELCKSVWSISFCHLQLNLFIITLKWPHLPSTKQTHIHHPGANISDISGQTLHVSLNRFCDLKSCKSSWSISFAQSLCFTTKMTQITSHQTDQSHHPEGIFFHLKCATLHVSLNGPRIRAYSL